MAKKKEKIDKSKEEIKFLLKVIRNSLILGCVYFISIWASVNEIQFVLHLKPVIIFIIGYVMTELVAKYKLNPTQIPKSKFKTLVL